MELWTWQKLGKSCSFRMGRVWRPEEDGKEEEKTVGEMGGREKGSGGLAGPTQCEGGGLGVLETLRSFTFPVRM